MNKSRLFLIILTIVLALTALTVFTVKRNSSELKKLTVGDDTLYVSVADSDSERTKGLSGAAPLEKNQGMIFVFPTDGVYPFWMYQMNYPLDFIWINDNKVVEITKNVPNPINESETPQTVVPNQPVDAVLEVNAGFTTENNINVGDLVTIQ